MKRLVFDQPLDFGQDDISRIRIRMTQEIQQGELIISDLLQPLKGMTECDTTEVGQSEL